MPPKLTESQIEQAKMIERWRRHPKVWVEQMFGLKPQPHLPEFEDELRDCIRNHDWLAVRAEWFQPFIRGQHITWQQWMILEGVGAAMRGEAPRRVSIRSGHGIGKSCSCAWLMLWFLMCYPFCRVGATAPSGDQLHDVLWTEAKKWIDKMPDKFAALYEWQSSYIRMAQDRE